MCERVKASVVYGQGICGTPRGIKGRTRNKGRDNEVGSGHHANWFPIKSLNWI